MPRTRRIAPGNLCFHVLNRGNRKSRVFHDDRDYRGFLHLMAKANRRLPMRILAYCLMPNHFHLVAWPWQDGDLGRWMHWLLTTHVRRHHLRYDSSGRVWQGRFKSFPIQQDHHLLTVLRYVERNPLRAELVIRAEDWRWSSLREWAGCSPSVLVEEGPIERYGDWLGFINEPVSDAVCSCLNVSVERERPYGEPAWIGDTARRLDLGWTLRRPGRPRAPLGIGQNGTKTAE